MSDTGSLFEVEPEELGIEPEGLGSPTLEIEPELAGLTPAQEQTVAEALRDIDAAAPLVAMPLMEVLPADFPLPILARFVPDVRRKQQAEQAAAHALSVDVTGPEGLSRADVALAALRDSQKAIKGHFAEPCEIADHLHKRLTGLRGEWLEHGEQAVKTVGQRVWTEQRRLDEIAAEVRRKAQERADAEAREQARKDAAAAEKQQAPPQVVEELKQRAETATAPPVAQAAAPTMRSTSVVTTWKARPKGTAADAEPNPGIAEMSPTQSLCVKELLAAILEDRAPITAIEVNYSVLNNRAKSDQKTFNIPGFEAFEHGGVRGKGGRRR